MRERKLNIGEMSEIIAVGQTLRLRRWFHRQIRIIVVRCTAVLSVSEACFGYIDALVRIEIDLQSTRSEIISGIGRSRVNTRVLCAGDARQTWKCFLGNKRRLIIRSRVPRRSEESHRNGSCKMSVEMKLILSEKKKKNSRCERLTPGFPCFVS